MESVREKGISLFVDDIRPAPEGWVLARTITEAIRILATQDVEAVSLDHDIAHQTNAETDTVAIYVSCNEDFTAVAHYLALMDDTMKEYGDRPLVEEVTIHTANPEGAKRIEAILRHTQYKVRVAPASLNHEADKSQ